MKATPVLVLLLLAVSVQAFAQSVAVMGAGMNPPADRNGDFEIGPDYRTPPEDGVVAGRPQGTVRQFVMDSKDSILYPGIGRDVFGTVDPNNPRTLIVKTHPEPWRRAITVYIPAHYKRGTQAPLLVVNDGPKLGDPEMLLPHVLDNLIGEHRVPAMIAVMVQNGGGDAQGSERGLEYDTLSGKYAEFIEREVLPQVESRYHVELTHDPNGRAAMGCSSGCGCRPHDGLVPPRVVSPCHQLLGDVRESAVAVQSGQSGWSLGLSRDDHPRQRTEAYPRLDGGRRSRSAESERHARWHARLGGRQPPHGRRAEREGIPISVCVRSRRRPLRKEGARADAVRGTAMGMARLRADTA